MSCFFSLVHDDVLVRFIHLDLVKSPRGQALLEVFPDEDSDILCCTAGKTGPNSAEARYPPMERDRKGEDTERRSVKLNEIVL